MKIKYEESDTVELKRELTDDIAKEIIAFLNSEGGIIYVGVKDNGEVAGIDRDLHDEIDTKLSSIITDSIKRNARRLIKYYFNKDNVLVIMIKKGDNKPYFLSYTGPRSNGTYIRIGRSKRQATDGEIISMIRDYSIEKREDEVCFNQELHFSFLKQFFKERNEDFGEDKFTTIGIQDRDLNFTNLALLLSDDNPIVVKMASYDNDLNFKYKKEFTGSILKIIVEVLKEAEMFNITSAIIPEYGGIRIETKSFPGLSLREAILNALCHADYSMPSNIKIEFYEERVQITNPGTIYRLNVEDILNSIQSFRNPRLIAFLHRLGFIENYGTGIKRIIQAYPEHDIKNFISNTYQRFRITLPDLNFKAKLIMDNVHNSVHNNVHNNVHNKTNKKVDKIGLIDTKENLLKMLKKFIEDNPKMSIKEMATRTGKNPKTIQRVIKNSGVIRFVGKTKAGYWEIINSEND